MLGLRPFWHYYGGKWRAAPRYPKPQHGTIIEPFAGSAGYSMRYPDHRVILIERYAVIAEMWRYLISVKASEIRRIPLVDAVDDLPTGIPAGARYLVGFGMNAANVSPCKVLSVGLRRLRAAGSRIFAGWTEAFRERVASQVDHIRHWRVIEGDYTAAPDIRATWFIDAPYNNKAGSYYVHADCDYAALARWAKKRRGQIIVCENAGATWLPFKPFAVFKSGLYGKSSHEVIYYREKSK